MDFQFDELIRRLRTAQGDNLVSVIAYGSAITFPDRAKKSDCQLLIVARDLAAGYLREFRPAIHWWTKSGYEMPVFFTAEELISSLDTYPIEFRQMKRAYRVIYGEDMLARHEPSPEHLRWQTEHELRGKLLRLRALALPASESASDLLNLMTESVVTFVRFMRPVLEIAGEQPPLDRVETALRVGALFDLDVTPVVRALELRREPKDLMEVEIQDLFARYLDCLVRLIKAVDKL